MSTSYCHLDEAAVVVGEEVLRDSVFAKSGNSGASKGPHVHYVVRIGRQSFDPLHFHPVPHGTRGQLVVAPRVAVGSPPADVGMP